MVDIYSFFAEMSFERWAIWLWMYCKNVRNVNCPILWWSCDHSRVTWVMPPPAHNACAPTRSRSTAWRRSLRSLAVSRTILITLCAYTFSQLMPFQTEHTRVLSLPRLERISWKMRDNAVTGHSVVLVECCVIVWPILTFSWFETFMTARSAFSSSSSEDVSGITTPSLNKPDFPTKNCLVRVSGTCVPFLITNRGFVYSPTLRKK